jgi:beta-lactamase superfamily II metal-dependent hydrolase
MSFNGIEIFFQNLGDADSSFVRSWANGVPTNILIDGGWKKDADQVELFLRDRAQESGEASIHHLVCSHSHDDHAGGLVELVERATFPIVQAWVHDTRVTHAVLTERRARFLAAYGSKASRVLGSIQESEQTRHALLEALEARRISISSPFAGARIGSGTVLGPTENFFDSQFGKLEDEARIEAWNNNLNHRWLANLFEQSFQEQTASDDDKELGDFVSPENEVSTIIAFVHENEILLLTGDAGCEALTDVVTRFGEGIRSIKYMQIPHHGSRRNLNLELISHLSPRISFVSCEGTPKHPSKKLVNALKGQGGRVFSTHYSVNTKCWLRQSIGAVPALTVTPAIPLYDK